MEQQTVSIAKAGIIASLNARTSVLACANPSGSRYNPRLSVIDNIHLPPTLLSRSDLIYLILDKADEQTDRRLAKHIAAFHFENPENSEQNVIDLPTLTAYLSYARKNIHPQLTDEVVEELTRGYVEMRRRGNFPGSSKKVITATPRQIESLIRLSEALARIRFSEWVEKKDVLEAFRLHEVALQQSATDHATGTIDIDLITTGVSASERMRRDNMVMLTRNIVMEKLQLGGQTIRILEGVVGHRDEESAATVYIPISENNSSLTKQANKDTEEIPLGSSKLREFELGTNPKLSNVKLSSAQADLGHKDEERAADVYEPIYKNRNSSFLSSLTKQGNDVAEQDFGSPKSNQFEIETKQKLPNVKLSSAKVNTWPCYQQRNVEEPPNCFSDSPNFKVHTHRDAIRCDLKASGSGLHSVKESASILPSEETHFARLDDMMMCDLPEQRESLLELQAAEAVVTQVDDDTPEMSEALIQPIMFWLLLSFLFIVKV